MKLWALMIIMLLLSSCGGLNIFTEKSTPEIEREIASQAVMQLLSQEEGTFENDIDEKLLSLHFYYVIALKKLHLFDHSIANRNLQELYLGSPYLSLLATRTQIDEIEKDFLDLHRTLRHEKKKLLMMNKIRAFSHKSHLHALSVRTLSHKLSLDMKMIVKDASQKEIDQEYGEISKINEFQVYEKNIEHLSHLMEMNLSGDQKKWKPSEDKRGALTGQEFPSKVWALTISNGPALLMTREMARILSKENLKATFFFEGQKTRDYPEEAKHVMRQGMEVATQSFSSKELTKVGFMTLEKEITEATHGMEKSLKIDVKFFRLPYGSGVDVPHIRDLIAKNKLIHVLWNVDSLDWPPQTADRIVERTKRLMKKTSTDAGIILIHDGHPGSTEVLSGIVKHLKLEARRVCPLGVIVKEMNQGQKTVCSNNSF